MKNLPLPAVIAAVLVSLVVGGVVGFGVGVLSTKVGKEVIKGLVDGERKADLTRLTEVNREKFQLKYPANWKVDTADEDYDPDTHFSIDSPGSAFVMFAIGNGELNPENMLGTQIAMFQKLLGTPSISNFERYGELAGKGAVLKGRIMGIRTTVKVFSFSRNGMTVMITQQCPDEDEKNVQPGLNLIEKSFSLKGE